MREFSGILIKIEEIEEIEIEIESKETYRRFVITCDLCEIHAEY